MTTFAVFEIYPDNTEEEVGTISVEKSSIATARLLEKHGLSRYFECDQGYSYAVVLMVLELYGFSKLSGYTIYWENTEHTIGRIYWRVDTWRIRKIEEEQHESIQYE